MTRITALLLAILLSNCGGEGKGNSSSYQSSSLPSYSVSGSIGAYMNEQLSSFIPNSKFVELGNGLTFDGKTVKGWPSRAGNHFYTLNGLVLNVTVSPLLTEVLTNSKGEKIAILWETPERNKVVSIDVSGRIATLTPDDGGVRWQLSSDTNHRNITWINFPLNKGHDEVVFHDRETGLTQTVHDENTVHRKPRYSNGYLYWYQESLMPDGDREISIVKHKVGAKSDVNIVVSSRFPNTITDYAILPNEVVATIRKNYDQQRSEIVMLSGNGSEKIIYEEDSFIQNLIAKSDKNQVAFEIKNHHDLWRVGIYDFDRGSVEYVSKKGMNSLLAGYINNEFAFDFFESPMDPEKITEILLKRFSPAILGLSLYDNRFGTLSITEAPIIRSLMNIAEAKNNISYWYQSAERVKNIINRTDAALRITSFDGVSGPHWSTRAFSINNGSNIPFLVHDASILDALLLLANKLKADPELNARYPKLYAQIIDLFFLNYKAQEKNLVRFSDDRFNIIKNGEAYFVFAPGSPYKYDGVNLPFNMMNSYIRPLILYSSLTNDGAYKSLACAIGSVFKRHLVYQLTSDAYEWPYWWGLYRTGWKVGTVSLNTPQHTPIETKDIADVDHASLDFRAVASMAKSGLTFGSTDIDRFANKMTALVNDGDYKSPLLIDGTIKSANYNSIEYLWGELAEYNVGARASMAKVARDFPYIQDAYTPTARFELVGLSHGALKCQVQRFQEKMLHGKNLRSVEC